MQEPDTRAFLLAMRRKLVKERELINKQIRACDTLLGGSPSELEMPEPPPGEGVAPPPARSTAPAPSPAAPSPEPAPFLSEAQKLKLLSLTGGNARGAIQARVELLVAECGETFSVRDVLLKYQATYGDDRYRLTESISSALWKLARRRGYQVVRAGSGTRPTLYGKQRAGQPAATAIRSA